MSDDKLGMAGKSLKEIVKNGPEFTRDSPLDESFEDLYSSVLSKLSDSKSYSALGKDNNEEFVQELLKHLGKIHKAACEKQKEDNNELLPISLHDMRHLDTLIKLILFHGVEANLPFDARSQTFPAELGCTILGSHQANRKTLSVVIKALYDVVSDKSVAEDYVRSVVIKGPLFQAIILGLAHLFCSTGDGNYENMIYSMEMAQQTYELFNIYTVLVDSVKNSELRSILLSRLGSLPVRRSDGVLSLIDFVTGARESEQIDVEKVCRVTEILVAKPKKMSSVQYFTQLFDQVREQLSHINRPIVITCLNDLISNLWRKNRRIIHDFLFKSVFEVLFNISNRSYSAKQVNDVINILISLTKNPSTEVIDALTAAHGRNKFYLHLWIYALFLKKFQTLSPIVYDNEGNKIEEKSAPYYNVILSLIKSYMVLTNRFEPLNHLTLNLINFDHPHWKYVVDLQTHLVSITVKDEIGKLPRSLTTTQNERSDSIELFKDMDTAVDLFMNLLNLIGNEEVIKNIFLNVLSRWVKSTIEDKNSDALDNNGTSALVLVDLKILERMNKDFSTELVKKPDDIFMLVSELLDSVTPDEKEAAQANEDSDDEDDDPIDTTTASPIFDTLLALLELLTDGDLEVTSAVEQALLEIRDKLRSHDNPTSQRLQSKINQLLKKTKTPGQQTLSNPKDSQMLREAMANLNDPIDPIKVQGLTLLSRLAARRSDVVQFPTFRAIFLQHLRYPDPYVYLSAVKGLAVLCECDPTVTIDALLNIYLNPDHKHKTDDILKVGESLSLYVQREGELFQGPRAHSIVDACLAIVRKHSSLDNKIRMSAVSLIGECLRANAIGIQDRIAPILDCVFGVLQLETDYKKKDYKDAFVVRRAAIHLVFDLLNDNGFDLLPDGYNRDKLVVLLNYARDQDGDTLVRQHADEILKLMDSLSVLQI